MSTYHEIESWLSWMDELSQNNFVVIDGFIKDELYIEIKDFIKAKKQEFTQAGIGASDDRNIINTKIRGDQTYWLNRDEGLNEFWKLVDETMFMFNRYCFLSLSGSEFHLAHYPPGGHYEKHVDQFESRNNRLISVVIYLNENWTQEDGGELEVYRSDSTPYLIEPIARRCVLFRSSEVPHAVLESKASRYSLTGWLLYQPASVGQLFG